MRKLTGLLLSLLVGTLFLVSCGSNNNTRQSSAKIVVNNDAGLTADELDLQAVGEIVRNCKNAEVIEQKINDESVGVNNVDLDKDGNIDYLNVQEYGSGNNIGFSISAGQGENLTELTSIDITINRATGQADMHISGNPDIYGEGYGYHSNYNSSNMLLMAYLMRPHRPYYHSPYYHGYYPTYYRPYRHVSRASYQTRTRTVTRTSTVTKSKPSAVTSRRKSSTAKSPNAGKTSKKVKPRSIKNSTGVQKSLQKKNSKNVNQGGGFGNKSTTSKPSSTSKSSSYKSNTRSSSSSSKSKPKSSSSSYSKPKPKKSSSFGGSRSRSRSRRRK